MKPSHPVATCAGAPQVPAGICLKAIEDPKHIIHLATAPPGAASQDHAMRCMLLARMVQAAQDNTSTTQRTVCCHCCCCCCRCQHQQHLLHSPQQDRLLRALRDISSDTIRGWHLRTLLCQRRLPGVAGPEQQLHSDRGVHSAQRGEP
jgi:hypothetical protein